MKIIKFDKKEFILKIDFLAIRKVYSLVRRRDGSPLDLMKLIEIKPGAKISGGLLDEFADDTLLLLEVIFVLLRDQFEKAGISEEDFYAKLTADEIVPISDAFLEELIDFFPTAESRVLRMLYEKITQIRREGEKMLSEALDSKETTKNIEQKIRGILHGEQPEFLE